MPPFFWRSHAVLRHPLMQCFVALSCSALSPPHAALRQRLMQHFVRSLCGTLSGSLAMFRRLPVSLWALCFLAPLRCPFVRGSVKSLTVLQFIRFFVLYNSLTFLFPLFSFFSFDFWLYFSLFCTFAADFIGNNQTKQTTVQNRRRIRYVWPEYDFGVEYLRFLVV